MTLLISIVVYPYEVDVTTVFGNSKTDDPISGYIQSGLV